MIFSPKNKKNVHAYIIASPLNTHYEYIKKILAKKKPLIIEKPIVKNIHELKKINILSHNAKHPVLVNHTDLYNPAFKKLEKKVLIINKSVYKFITTPFKKPFNLVFLDPPFKENNIVEIIDSLKKTGKLDKNALFIVHRHKKSKDMFPESFKILDEKKYGLSKIIFGN